MDTNEVFLEEIRLDGFQMISGSMFKKIPKPLLSIWYNRIVFNRQAIKELQDCETVQMQVNPKKKQIVVIPVSSSDKDAIQWNKPNELKQPPKMECASLTSQLYSMWGWNKYWHYRTNGKKVKSSGKVMLLFDFSECECLDGGKQVKTDV